MVWHACVPQRGDPSALPRNTATVPHALGHGRGGTWRWRPWRLDETPVFCVKMCTPFSYIQLFGFRFFLFSLR